jgi:hypothetical protein
VLQNAGLLAQCRLADMGGKCWQLHPLGRDKRRFGAFSLALSHRIRNSNPLQHPFARRFGCRKVAIGAAFFRQLRQGDEKGCLCHRQPLRLLAEIGKARGPDALKIAAIGRMGEIEIKYLFLREPPLDLDGARHLLQLGRERASLPRLDQARHLHRQG